MNVPLVRPALGEEEVEAAARVIRSGWIMQGPEVAAFEAEMAAAVGAPFAVAVSSGTSALELSLRALGVGAGDEVVTVSHSFIATANAVVAVGARPVFVDIEPDTYGLDPRALEPALTPRTRAILCVHQLGIPCDLAAIGEIAARKGLPLVEDAACAIGSEIQLDGRWERIGKPRGRVACFSFHPRKVVTTGDGGMITTADAALAARLKILRQHAMTLPDTIRPASKSVVFDAYIEPAFNCRMTDIQAAVGRPQLRRLDAIIAERRALADRYARAFENHPVVAPPRERPWARGNWQSYPLTLRPGCGVGQVQAMQLLLDRGVAVRRGVHNAHQEPAYADRLRGDCPHPAGCLAPTTCGGPDHHCERLRVSEHARDNTILIPLFHGMTAAEQDHVIAACNEVRA